LSGCVTTAATENLSSRASDVRLAQDNSAVPMKTIRNAVISGFYRKGAKRQRRKGQTPKSF
jgi:outer membrane murein-binding lipoprotein Lpp